MPCTRREAPIDVLVWVKAAIVPRLLGSTKNVFDDLLHEIVSTVCVKVLAGRMKGKATDAYARDGRWQMTARVLIDTEIFISVVSFSMSSAPARRRKTDWDNVLLWEKYTIEPDDDGPHLVLDKDTRRNAESLGQGGEARGRGWTRGTVMHLLPWSEIEERRPIRFEPGKLWSKLRGGEDGSQFFRMLSTGKRYRNRGGQFSRYELANRNNVSGYILDWRIFIKDLRERLDEINQLLRSLEIENIRISWYAVNNILRMIDRAGVKSQINRPSLVSLTSLMKVLFAELRRSPREVASLLLDIERMSASEASVALLDEHHFAIWRKLVDEYWREFNCKEVSGCIIEDSDNCEAANSVGDRYPLDERAY